MDTTSYLSFAEEDHRYLKECYDHHIQANIMPAIAQGACGKYLKHVIDIGYVPDSHAEEEEKTQILRTHSLHKLLDFISDEMGIDIDADTMDEIEKADGYYFSARYPGDDSIEVRPRDIERSIRAMEACREESLSIIKDIEVNQLGY